MMGVASPWQKYQWAEHHVHLLEDEVRIFEKSHRHEFVCKPNAEATEYVFTVQKLQPTEPHWGLILGDCFHNLRAALDHLAYELAVSATNGTLTPEQERQVMFPIFDTFDKYKRHGRWRIAMLRSDDRTRIEELQPYNSGSAKSDWEHWYGQLNSTLWRLDALDVIDKHRSVHVAQTAIEWKRTHEPPVVSNSQLFMGSLKDGAEVARWTFNGQPAPPMPSQVEMHRYFPIEVAIDSQPWAIRVGEAIHTATSAVRIVLDMFEPSLAHGASPLPLPARSAQVEEWGVDWVTPPSLWDEQPRHWPPPVPPVEA